MMTEQNHLHCSDCEEQAALLHTQRQQWSRSFIYKTKLLLPKALEINQRNINATPWIPKAWNSESIKGRQLRIPIKMGLYFVILPFITWILLSPRATKYSFCDRLQIWKQLLPGAEHQEKKKSHSKRESYKIWEERRLSEVPVSQCNGWKGGLAWRQFNHFVTKDKYFQHPEKEGGGKGGTAPLLSLLLFFLLPPPTPWIFNSSLVFPSKALAIHPPFWCLPSTCLSITALTQVLFFFNSLFCYFSCGGICL